MIIPRLLAASAGLLSVLPRQSSTVSDLWRVPDAVQSDFDQIYAIGEVVNLLWNGGYNDSYSDLWVTAANESVPYAQLLTSKLCARRLLLFRPR